MILKKITTYAKYALAPIFVFILSAYFVHAADTTTATTGLTGTAIGSILGHGLNDLIAWLFAQISWLALEIMSFWVATTSVLLNTSIVMTLRIKDFVDSTPGVYLVWETIRDISGMFVIFMLLFASFKIILGFDTVGGVGGLIKNIVIMGVLINFSFFLTSLLIDASNMVSLALYHGIVGTSQDPNYSGTACTSRNGTASVLSTCGMTNSMIGNQQPGLSDIILNLLQPQTIYSTSDKNAAQPDVNAKPIAIIVQGVVGCIIMFSIGFSFLIASIAFVIRLIFLVILLAFSPIWFASMIVPGIAEKTKEFENHLIGQLIFMPVYLLLLYAALRFLSSSTVFTNPSGNAFTGTGSQLSFNYLNYIVLFINDFIVLFLLNLPLVTAISMGGKSTEIANKWGSSLKSQTTSFLGRKSVGWGAATLRDSSVVRKIETISPVAGRYLNKGLTSAATAGFGGGKNAGYDQVTKKRTEEYAKLAEHSGLNDDEKSMIKSYMANETNILPAIAEKHRAEYEDKRKKSNQSVVQKAAAEAQGKTLTKQKKELIQKQDTIQKQIATAIQNGDETAQVAHSARANAIGKQIEQMEKEIAEADTLVKGHEGAIKSFENEAKDLPKQKILDKWKTKGKFGRGVHRQGTKEKDPNADVMAALKDLQSKVGDGSK